MMVSSAPGIIDDQFAHRDFRNELFRLDLLNQDKVMKVRSITYCFVTPVLSFYRILLVGVVL